MTKQPTQHRTYGYARVSTDDQVLDRQLDALLPYVDEQYVYTDRLSGKDMERPGWQRLTAEMRPGDVLYVKSIDRLGRNKAHVSAAMRALKDMGVTLRIIDLPTTMREDIDNDLIIDMVNTILIEVFTTMAEQERTHIKQRQREGIESAKKRGKSLGRPSITLSTLDAEQRRKLDAYYREWKTKAMTGVAFAELLGMKKNTFYKVMKEYEAAINDK